MKRKNNYAIFLGKLHGATYEDNSKSETAAPQVTDERKESPLFGDPETDYNHLSDEEKEQKTAKMMSHFKSEFARTPMGG